MAVCGGFNDDVVQDNTCYEDILGGFSFGEQKDFAVTNNLNRLEHFVLQKRITPMHL